MDKVRKLIELMDDIKFKDIDGTCSVEELREAVRYNVAEYAKLEAKGEHLNERILDLISLILAEKLQPMAINSGGDTGESSLEHVVSELFQTPEATAEWEKARSTIVELLRDDGLDESQIEALAPMLDSVPGQAIDSLVELAGRLKVIPVQEVANITRVLASMMKEEEYDHNPTDN